MLEKPKKVYKNISQYIKKKYTLFIKRLKEAKIRIVKKIRLKYEENKAKVDWTAEFMAVILIYGLILNFVFCVLLNMFEIRLKSILAFGFVFYFVKEELPRIIIKCKLPK